MKAQPRDRQPEKFAMINRPINSIRTSYDAVADEYVRRIAGELEHKPLDRHLLDQFAADVQDLGLACDRGCGPGHVARYLRERGVEVVGVDLSPVMVDHARKLNPGIEFLVGDMRALALKDHAFGGAGGPPGRPRHFALRQTGQLGTHFR
jgi:SAM-dependent methyltransferase